MSPSRSASPLSGLRILVGRAEHQANTLASGLAQLGAEVLSIPFLEIRPPRSYQGLDDALATLERYQWLILTSVNGVEALGQRIAHLGIGPEAWQHLQVAAIGPSTARALAARGFRVDVVPPKYVAEAVVESLKDVVAGKRILLARARVARDVLPRELRRLGARVKVVEAYETVVPESSRRQLRRALDDVRRRPHVVAFTSSSSVRNFLALARTGTKTEARAILAGIRLASIGPITSASLRASGLAVDIEARQYDIPGLILALRDHAWTRA